jgi:hypothetical protein
MAGETTGDVVHVANVIEADINQLLGACLQYLSLRDHPRPLEYYLVIVDRAAEITAQFVEWGRSWGLHCGAAPPASQQVPYLNRWLFQDVFPPLREAAHVVFLDWDIIYAGQQPIPAPRNAGQILCRRNPLDMYRALIRVIREQVPAKLLAEDLDLISSVNAGVIIGHGSALVEFAIRNRLWIERVFEALDFGHLTDKEQLAFSLAVGEFGLERLDDPWNVTPLSPVADRDVQLWHYNNSVYQMLQLKRQLVRPQQVRATCEHFAAQWPQTMGKFAAFYQEAIGCWPFPAFLRGDSRPA